MTANLNNSEAEIYGLLNNVNEGYVNALQAYVLLKELSGKVEEIIDTIQPLAVQESEKYEGKQFKAFGVLIEKRDGTRRWSYPDFTPYNAAKERAKALEALMQNVANTGAQLVDAETGEVVPAAKCTYSKPTIAIKGVK
jgi:hypothetical protein